MPGCWWDEGGKHWSHGCRKSGPGLGEAILSLVDPVDLLRGSGTSTESDG